MQRRPPKNCDDWWPTTLYSGNASPLGPASRTKKPKPLGLLAARNRAVAKKRKR